MLQGVDTQALQALGWAVALFLSTLGVMFSIRAAWRRGLGGIFGPLPRALTALDGLLVQRVTFLFGTRWNRFPRAGLARWSHLTASLFGLALATALAPRLLAYAAAGLGLIGVIAIFRQWSWDEEDRSAGVPAQDRRIRVDNDLTNEGLFAIAALFLLFPPLLYRLQTGGAPLLGNPEVHDLAGYTAFVLEQFRQAVPFLNNIEVYGDAPLLGVKPVSEAGQHAAFGLRLTFELVLIAGVLLIIDVSRKIASGRDLRELVAALVAVDEARNRAAVEHLFELARRGNMGARDLLQQCALGEVDAGKPTRTAQWVAADQLVSLARFRPDYGMVLLTVAIDGYRRVRADLSNDPQLSAHVSNRLGNALHMLGGREGGEAGKSGLEQAVSAYRAALEVYTREAMPSDWANTQNYLAVTLVLRGRREGGEAGKAYLEEAVSAYRAAHEVHSRGAMPAAWARTQNNLGFALRLLGEWEGGEAGIGRLEEAVSAYRAALEVRTREAMPVEWAATQNNLAQALAVLVQREGGEERLEEAVLACRASLEVYTRAATPSAWANAQNNLAYALTLLGRWEGGEAGKARVEEAVSAYFAALEVYTKEAMPANWASTQNNLAIALKVLGEQESGEAGKARLEAAVSAYRASLEVYTREAMPSDWATTQNNMASALRALGEREDGEAGRARLEEARRVLLDLIAYGEEVGDEGRAEAARSMLAELGTAS